MLLIKRKILHPLSFLYKKQALNTRANFLCCCKIGDLKNIIKTMSQ